MLIVPCCCGQRKASLVARQRICELSELAKILTFRCCRKHTGSMCAEFDVKAGTEKYQYLSSRIFTALHHDESLACGQSSHAAPP